MKTLQGWARFNVTKAQINAQLIKAQSDTRLASIAKRVQVLEQAIRKMNHNNGAFLDKPAIVQAYSVSQMKTFQANLTKASK